MEAARIGFKTYHLQLFPEVITNGIFILVGLEVGLWRKESQVSRIPILSKALPLADFPLPHSGQGGAQPEATTASHPDVGGVL